MLKNAFKHVLSALKYFKRIDKLFMDSEVVKGTSSPVANDAVTEQPANKRRKKDYVFALLMAYQGKKYNGMQVQKDFPTIEGVLFHALAQCGYISHEDTTTPFRFYFQRAARTDRTVSAARQMCSMRISTDDLEDFLATSTNKINSHLPEEIRVFGLRRTTPSFIAHKMCDKRTYSYTTPTYAFANCDELTTNSYRMDDEEVTEVNDLLSMYIGTHNFWNYTSRKSFTDRSSYRHIYNFKCGPKHLYKDELGGDLVEFITLHITGQSFMLHQIRKMIGMVIAAKRGLCNKEDILRTFDKERMDVPKAPGLGLVLEKVHYERYDRRFCKTHAKLDDWGEDIEKRIEEFKQRYIIEEIMEEENSTHSMFMWLTNLLKHDFVPVEDEMLDAPRTPLARAAVVAQQANDGVLSEQDMVTVYFPLDREIKENDESKNGNETILKTDTNEHLLKREASGENDGFEKM